MRILRLVFITVGVVLAAVLFAPQSYAQDITQLEQDTVNNYPTHVIFQMALVSDERITHARFYLQHGDSPAEEVVAYPIATHEAGQRIILTATWAPDNAPTDGMRVSTWWELTFEDNRQRIVGRQDGLLLEAPTPFTAFAYAETSFQTHFPEGITSQLEVTPQDRITEVRFFVTIDGVSLFTQDIEIPRHMGGDTITLTANWDGISIGGQPFPPFLHLQTWWRLTDETGNAEDTPVTRRIYADTGGRSWLSLAGDHVTVYTYNQPGSFQSELLQAADEAMQQLSASYGYDLPYRPVVIIYNSAQDADTDLSAPLWEPFGTHTNGRAYPGSNAVVVLAMDSANTTRVIKHELAHLFQFQLGEAYFYAPLWWIEGDAHAYEPSAQRSLIDVQNLIEQRPMPQLISWQVNPTIVDDRITVMKVGASFVMFLKSQFGLAAYADFYANWYVGADFYQAFEMTYGASLPELDVLWRSWLLDGESRLGYVNVNLLNVRTEPTTDAFIVNQLPTNTLISPLGRTDDEAWLFVRTLDGREGWVSSEYVIYNGSVNRLPVQSP